VIQRHMTTNQLLDELAVNKVPISAEYVAQAAAVLRSYATAEENTLYGLCFFMEQQGLSKAYPFGEILRSALRPEADALRFLFICYRYGKTPERLATAEAWANECENLAKLV